jgi:hypothetical protein
VAKKGKKKKGKGGKALRPKKKCCKSKPRCRRCPVRLKKEGLL